MSDGEIESPTPIPNLEVERAPSLRCHPSVCLSLSARVCASNEDVNRGDVRDEVEQVVQ